MEGREIKSPIGIFDSGYGGLTILRRIQEVLPHYDYLYLGDNARAPYGNRSFELVYQFTLQAVKYLFSRGCHLVILACNTASAKALRTIQQKDLPEIDPTRRVLGVIRPTVEALPRFTKNGEIGIFATPGTIASRSYDIEIEKLHPDFKTTGQDCALWVPLIENGETQTEGADFFIARDVDRLIKKNPNIDTVILGCTHYPMIKEKIAGFLPDVVSLIEQGHLVAESLKDYLERHPEIESLCSRNGETEYLTTESPEKFDDIASRFMKRKIKSQRITLN